MEIMENVFIEGLSLYLKEHSTIVISDVHLGFEESLNKQGILIPRTEFENTMNKLSVLINNLNPERIVINGDVKHEFGTISRQEWNKISELIRFCKENAELILIKGNHDVILEPIARKNNIPLVDHFSIGKFYICHGHEIPENFGNSEVVIIGNEHPAVTLRDEIRAETYKAFLKGSFKDKTLLVTPSFHETTLGTDVLRGRLLSPFLQKDLSSFEVFLTSEKETLYFGKVENLKDVN